MSTKQAVMNTHLYISDDLSTVLKTKPLPHEDFKGLEFHLYTKGSTSADQDRIFALEKINADMEKQILRLKAQLDFARSILTEFIR